MTSVASLALAQGNFNETGKMRSLINKRESAHHPKPISQVFAIVVWGWARAAAPSQVTEIHSRVRYLKGRINTESVLPHAAQTMGWWNRWKWTFVGVGKRRQRYGKRKRPALKRTRMVSHLLRADLACSVLSPSMFILSPLPHIIRLIMPSYTWFICHPPPLRTSTVGKHKCTKLYK